MRQTDFALYLGRFLTDYLPNKKGSSPRTIRSYRYSFLQLLDYYESVCDIPAMRLTLRDLTYSRVLGFLDWLQNERGVSAATRNQRQAALNSFLRFLVHEMPDHLDEYQRILGIPVKRAAQKRNLLFKTRRRNSFNGKHRYEPGKRIERLCHAPHTAHNRDPGK